MKTHFREAIFEKIKLLDNISNIKIPEFAKLLNKLLESMIIVLSDYLNKHPLVHKRKISICNVKQELGVNFGLNRSQDKIIIAKWILELQPKTRSYLLTFFLIKESLHHFIISDLTEIDDVIINIIAILFLVELYDITSVDNPILSAIRSKIYSEEIAGLSLYYWDNLLLLFIRNKMSSSEVYKEYEALTRRDLISPSDKIKLFSEWTYSKTLKEGDSVFPFFTNPKLIELIETLCELGYEKSTTSFIARKLNLTQKTITKRFKALNENYFTYWRSDINYEKINLHNYLFKITIKDRNFSEKLMRLLLNIPYLKSLFLGSDSKFDILYSPTLICPHIISDQLNESLSKMKNKGLINDYFLQLVRERYRNFAITYFPFNPTINTLRELITNKDLPLSKYTFYHHKRSSVIPSEEKSMILDYNLLYFLSIIKTKLLLRARYGVATTEFKKFYLENDIPLTDVEAQTDLLYQNEMRAKNKSLLSFSLYMRSLMKRSPDVLIFEVPTTNGISDKEFLKIKKDLLVFSLLGQNTLYDRHVFNLPGVAHTHPIRKVIQDFLEKEGLTPTFYTIKLYKTNFVPLQDLYDFEDQKWKITDFKE